MWQLVPLIAGALMSIGSQFIKDPGAKAGLNIGGKLLSLGGSVAGSAPPSSPMTFSSAPEGASLLTPPGSVTGATTATGFNPSAALLDNPFVKKLASGGLSNLLSASSQPNRAAYSPVQTTNSAGEVKRTQRPLRSLSSLIRSQQLYR